MSRRWDECKKKYHQAYLRSKLDRHEARRQKRAEKFGYGEKPIKFEMIHKQPAKPIQKGFFSNIKNRMKDFFGRRK
jgi:hypothetical protein